MDATSRPPTLRQRIWNLYEGDTPAGHRFRYALLIFDLVTIAFVLIGILGGIFAGLFGVGGGIILVPALIYWAGFSQQKATGTSLAVLLPPIGLAATIEYWRHGNVDAKAAVILAATMFVGSWLGALVANRMKAK